MSNSHPSFQPNTYICLNCKTKMQSSYSGEFVPCKCGLSFVDQTHFYDRVGGQAVLYKDKDEHPINDTTISTNSSRN